MTTTGRPPDEVRATATELAELQAPPTGWHIDSGAEGLAGW
jgi:hypothetical protein